MNKNKWFLNGGRGSGRTIRLLCEEYENKIEELERKLEQTEKDLADYQFNYPTIKELQKENAELQHKVDTLQGYLDHDIEYDMDKTIEELRKENAELKDEWQEQVQKATDEGYARTLQTIQLSKAKDIIKNLMVYVPVDLKEYEEAKQFLSEVVE